MNEHGPFDRMRDTGQRDQSARYILIGMGALGLLLLVLVFTPLSPFGGDDDGGNAPGNQTTANGVRLPRVPDGFEALSQVFTLQKPRGTNGPYAITLNLAQPLTDGRNLGLYTNNSGNWERVAGATLANNGTAAAGEVPDIPGNLAVLRRTTSAALVSGWLPAGQPIDPIALDVLTTVNPVDYLPGPDGNLIGTASQLGNTKGTVLPVVRALEQKDVETLNTLLASPALREAHIAALLAVAQAPGNGGIELDYRLVNPARKADYTAFITVLSDRLHQGGKVLSIALPAPTKAGVAWDTGAYDWDELGRRADTLKLTSEADPSIYFRRMEEVLTFLKPKLDMRKVVLIVTRTTYEKGTDGLRQMSLRDGLTLASDIEVRTTAQIVPNASVVIIGKNIFQDDGASGLRWDEAAFAVSFSYPGRGGQRTVWLENALSIAFKLDLARRYGLAGISMDSISADAAYPNLWEALRSYAETGNVNLVQPNSVLLRPTWQIQAGASEPNAKGNIVWKAPAQPGAYDVALVISDGVIRAMQKTVLEVRQQAGAAPAAGTPAAGTPGAGTPAAGTPRPGTPAAGATPVPTTRP